MVNTLPSTTATGWLSYLRGGVVKTKDAHRKKCDARQAARSRMWMWTRGARSRTYLTILAVLNDTC
jgi:thymidylate synthase ThyX